jgi:prevent-host-death family protein
MAVWQVQEAKTRLSELIEEANTKGPQFITRHGSERAVILSVADYRAAEGVTSARQLFAEFFGVEA